MNQKFCLYAFFGKYGEDADYFMTYFSNREISSGYSWHELTTSKTIQDNDNIVRVCCNDLPGYPEESDSAKELYNLVGSEMIQSLRKAPFFVYAIIGPGDVSGVNIKDILKGNYNRQTKNAIIIHDFLLQKIQDKKDWAPFEEDYFWISPSPQFSVSKAG